MYIRFRTIDDEGNALEACIEFNGYLLDDELTIIDAFGDQYPVTTNRELTDVIKDIEDALFVREKLDIR